MCIRLVLLVSINFLFVLSSAINNNSDPGELIYTEGQLKVALILNECTLSNLTSRSYANAALWLVNRLNSLNFTHPLRLGLSVREVCSEEEYYDAVFKVYKDSSKFIYVNPLSSDHLPEKVRQFQKLLGVKFEPFVKHPELSIEASVGLLRALDLTSNVTAYSDSREVLLQFYELARENGVCVQSGRIFGTNSTFDWSSFDQNASSVVVFARGVNLDTILHGLEGLDLLAKFIFVNFDGTENHAFPEGSYVIQTTFMVMQKSNLELPSIIFELAVPILQATENISNFINEHCNETLYKFNCFRNKLPKLKQSRRSLSQDEVVEQLQLTSFVENFVYKIFLVENISYPLENENTTVLQSFEHVFTYKIFNKTVLNLETEEEFELNRKNTSESLPQCSALNQTAESILRLHIRYHYGLRSESWIYAFLAVSSLGVLFSLAVLIFLIIRLCKRDILEGNPVLTILLLVAVVLMYSSVIPFALIGDGSSRSSIILARALCSSLVYAYAFSLLLSRSILLATVSNEIGFMSHISGPVQSFLVLFIFGIQGALSLQLLNHCEDIFKGNFFAYLMAYNVMLLILLVFISPVNSRAHRNYREGRHFTVAVALISFVWSCWVPVYVVFDEKWRDLTVCSGLVATASVLLGAIFIPRTYKMAVAAAKDRLTNAIPSLPSSSSIMDVYRANSQPIYDCINFATVNAVTRTSSIPPPPPPQPQLYSSSSRRFEDDFCFENCIATAPSQDKVTRF